MFHDAVLILTDGIPDEVSEAITAGTNLALRGSSVEPGDRAERVALVAVNRR